MRELLLFIVALTGTIIVGFSQTQQSFEVVSVRPCQATDPRIGLRPESAGTRYIERCVPLRAVIWTIFRLHSDQVVGGPNWMDNDFFYIEGVASRPSAIGELHMMMRQALMDRFHLQFHRDKKDLDAYVLTVDKNGPKNIREHPPTNATDLAIDQKMERRAERIFHEEWTIRSSPMDFFVWRFSSRLGRPVVDQTGLRGAGYDFDLSFTNLPPVGINDALPNPALGPANPPLPMEPDMFDAFRDQLGLKLERRRAPVEVLVIDHVERPADN